MESVEEFLAEWHDGNPCVLVRTSGSTGAPKPMWAEKRRMLASARITCDFLGLKQGDTALLCMPLDYIAGKMVVVRSIERGLRLVAVPPSGHPLAALCEAPTFAAMVPMQVYNTLQVERERALLMQVKHLIIGGGAIDDELEKELRCFPNAVWSTYGMTETLSHIALRRISGAEASEWYSPFPSVHVSADEHGCLAIDAPEVCAKPLITNDRVEFASDGRRFRVIGRMDNVIDSGGIKVQIEEVERLLRPCINAPFMITKCRDKKFGEAVVLLAEDGDADALRSVCQSRLPRYWQPLHYHMVCSLPLTATGKPCRAEAERIANELGERE